jgi:tetratricopeptide (TPR) repeat protein
MILRDEEELLPTFLDHARGAYDELVAVDTGSRDGTPRLLAEAGAKVLHEPWRDDFAAARNVGLERARGDWIVVLDADELLSPEARAGIRSAVGDAQLGAATLLVRNPLPHGHAREERVLRLFRRDPSIRFRHAIHETVADDVSAFLRRRGLGMGAVPGAVEHLGYVRARAPGRAKRGRDVSHLERCLAADPLHRYRHFKLVEQAAIWDDRPLWARAAGAALRAMEAVPERLRAAPFAGELTGLVAEGLHRGDPRAALALLDRWVERVPPSAALRLRRGALRERLGVPGAGDDYRACLALAGREEVAQLASVRPRLGLARLALSGGDLHAALAEARTALRAGPRDPEALLLVATLERERGGRSGLLAFGREHARAHGDSTELHAAVGEVAMLAGDLELALGALATAAGEPPAGAAALLLAQALLASGDAACARGVASGVVRAQPEAALVILLCDLVEGRDSELELELEREEADRALRRCLAAVRAAGRPEVLDALRRSAPALAPIFDWFPAAVASS